MLPRSGICVRSLGRVTALSTALPQQVCGYATKPTLSAPALAKKAGTTKPIDENMVKDLEDYRLWRKTTAENDFKSNKPGKFASPNEDQPFPNNPLFQAETVVNDFTKRHVYKLAMEEGKPIRVIAAEIGLDIRRVAAIVRLQEAQRQWVGEGKKLATVYAKAVTGMLKTWGYNIKEPWANTPFEPVNDIHVHRSTMRQLFVPAAESRRFTRKDAAEAFHGKMLSVQQRSPQRGLIAMERKSLAKPQNRAAHWKEFEEEEQVKEEELATRLLAKKAAEDAATLRHTTDRFEFRIKEMSVEDVGRDGRARKGKGWRYGAPLQDRKRGIVKIPTAVPW